MAAVLILIAGISTFVLGLISLRQKSKVRISFSTFSFAVTLWIFVNFVFQVTHDTLLVRSFYALGALAVASGVVFAFYFLYRSVNRWALIITFLLAAVNFIIPLTTDLVIKRVDQIFTTGYIAVTGSYFIWYSIYLIAALSVFLTLMLVERRHTSGTKRNQINYIILGFGAFGLSTALVSFILPMFKVWNLTSLDSPSALFFVFGSFYAITKHKLLDVRLVILRTISYSIVVLFISATVVGLMLLLPEALSVNTLTKAFIAIFASFFIVLILDPLKKAIAKATDKLFFKAKVDYIKLQAELGEIINREIDLDVLLYSLAHKLEKTLKIKNASIYIAGMAGGAFFKRKGRVDRRGEKINEEKLEEVGVNGGGEVEERLAHNNSLIEFLRKEQRVIVLEALERKIEDTQEESVRKELEASKIELDKLDAAVVAPITVQRNLNAVMVLGPKLSGDPFGSEDLQLLDLLGPQLASALDKSRLYDEVKQFSERLKKEIAIATEDVRRTNIQLQERNRFLSALQTVTNVITRTLDFKKVTQSIADSIHTELGYLGGILLLLGKDRHKLFPDAVTQSALTPEVIKLLPKPLNQLWGDFRKDISRSVKAIKLGQVQIGTSLDEFLSPALPPDICARIQKLLKIKSIVAVPVYSEEGIVGVIDFLLDREPDTLKETDMSMMKALCNQTGIVNRNIQLYRQLEDSNKDLADANRHLQQLDQAKSEFVSIASHQLRTPMAGIMGYLSMILQSDFGKITKEQSAVIEKLFNASQRMIQLINLFLDVSKIESGKLVLDRRPIKLEEIIERAMDVLRKSAEEKGLKLIYNRPKKPLPEIMGDDKLFDVVSNLIDNSIKYTEKGEITVAASGTDGEVKVSVHDTGRGIDPEEAKGLFSKFVRGSGMAQVNPDGSGLGLYVARRITEAHGGKIWVESKGVGKGSTFVFTLPVQAVPAEKK